jgi:hypothetical protein
MPAPAAGDALILVNEQIRAHAELLKIGMPGICIAAGGF